MCIFEQRVSFPKLKKFQNEIKHTRIYCSFIIFLRVMKKKQIFKDIHLTSQTIFLQFLNQIPFRRLWKLLKVIVPSISSGEMGFMMLVAGSLIARTYCDVWMIQNGTAIERCVLCLTFPTLGPDSRRSRFLLSAPSSVGIMICSRRNCSASSLPCRRFLWSTTCSRWVRCSMIPIRSVFWLHLRTLQYGLSELKLRFRCRLSKYLYDKYLMWVSHLLSFLAHLYAVCYTCFQNGKYSCFTDCLIHNVFCIECNAIQAKRHLQKYRYCLLFPGYLYRPCCGVEV